MVGRAAVALAVLLLPLFVRAQQKPSFSIQAGGVVAATMPLAILADVDVKRQINSGLTATFLVVARNRTTTAASAARMEIRYDLWDEVWIVRRMDFDRKAEQLKITSKEALEKWWRTPLRLLATTAPSVSLQIDMTVLPFSAAEKEDARQWISKAGGVGSGGAGLVDALIGTTIDAKPITTYRWNVELALR